MSSCRALAGQLCIVQGWPNYSSTKVTDLEVEFLGIRDLTYSNYHGPPLMTRNGPSVGIGPDRHSR
jgi:hypothetical protein